jgi:hypothetical protein
VYDNNFKEKKTEFDDWFREGDTERDGRDEHEGCERNDERRVFPRPRGVCLLVEHAVFVDEAGLRWRAVRNGRQKRY